MRDAFVPFEVAFAPAACEPQTPAAERVAETAPETHAMEIAENPAAPEVHEAALSAVRRFRASLADALDAQLEHLLRDVACEVLGRELQLAPAAVAEIARSALERFAADVPLRLRAHPLDATALEALDLPVVTDAALHRGDLTIELRGGTIDASLGARLEALLAAR